jgi:hypothetical protein
LQEEIRKKALDLDPWIGKNFRTMEFMMLFLSMLVLSCHPERQPILSCRMIESNGHPAFVVSKGAA